MATQALYNEFRLNLAKASELLDFFLQERVHVPDEIIDEIEAARERLDAGPASLSKDDLAKLRKVYRELLAAPRCSSTYDGVPPPTFLGMDSPWRKYLIRIGVIPSLLALVAGIIIFQAFRTLPNGSDNVKLLRITSQWLIYGSLIYPFVSFLAFWTLYAFTGVATDKKLNQIIRVCYVTTAIFLVLSIVPFLFPLDGRIADEEGPIGLVKGCATKINNKDYAPEEVRCNGDNSYQWVVRIGGTEKPYAAFMHKTEDADLIPPETLIPASDKREIHGGIVVPLYVIFLALIGGTVSMTRRIPEYQRRAMDSRDSMTNVQAREYLVFQVLQVVSAPLIAITAYYIVSPANAATSVVLGFGSGFASEPILLLIRGLVEKISPAKETPPAAVTVSVTPLAVTLAPKEGKQFTANVAGTTNLQVTWSIDPTDGSAGTVSENGHYVAPDSAVGKVVTITARSMADPTKSGSASVKIEPSVKVTPAATSVRAGQHQQFKADVLGLSDRNITWELDPPANAGSITNGNYIAPAAITVAPAVTVIARSVADKTRFGSAKITLQP